MTQEMRVPLDEETIERAEKLLPEVAGDIMKTLADLLAAALWGGLTVLAAPTKPAEQLRAAMLQAPVAGRVVSIVAQPHDTERITFVLDRIARPAEHGRRRIECSELTPSDIASAAIRTAIAAMRPAAEAEPFIVGVTPITDPEVLGPARVGGSAHGA